MIEKMRFFFVTLLLFNTVIAQKKKYHEGEIVSPGDSIAYLKSTMKPIDGYVYNEKGTLGLYKNGKKEGLHKRWMYNMYEEKNYVQGNLEGYSRLWYDKSQQLKSEEYYHNNKIEGISRYWYENGQMNYEINWKDDQLNGIRKGWHQNGIIMTECLYVNGLAEGIDRQWYDNGQLHHETRYSNGKKNGISQYWYKNGQLWSESVYIDDVEKSYKYWDENGTQIETVDSKEP